MKVKVKGLTLTAQQLKFAGGIILAIIVAFGVWHFIMKNRYERVSEQSAARLASAINSACENGQAQVVNVYFPQEVGFKGWLYQTVGIPGANIGTDPYFYVYYDQFPPPTPSLLNLPWDPYTGLIAPWSEDLPWSSNMMTTMAIDMAMFGVQLGVGKITPTIKNALAGKFADFSTSPKVQKLINAGKIVVSSKNVVIKEAKYLGVATAAGTLACLALTDMDLTECIYTSAVVYSSVRIMYKANQYMSRKYHEKTLEAGTYVTLQHMEAWSDEMADMGTDFALEEFKNHGYITQVGNKLVATSPEWEGAIKQYAIDHGITDKLGYFEFSSDGEILLDKDGLKNEIRGKLMSPWEKLKENVGEAFGQKALAPDGMHILANQIDVVDDATKISIYNKWVENGNKVPVFVLNEDKVKYVDGIATNLRKAAEDGSVILLPKDSEILNILDRGADPETLSRYSADWLKKAGTDPIEAGYVYNLRREVRYRIGDKMKKLASGTVGYTILRIQDLYTPLGATWWDRQITYYQGVDICGEDELCLRSGYRVLHYPLEECGINGVTKIKLYRRSLNPLTLHTNDPTFYLVSPCFAKVDIWRDGDTVFLEPRLCTQKPDEFKDVPNYCYATAGIVDFWISTETASFAADCIANIVCCAANWWNACEGGIGIWNSLAACLGIGPKLPDLCGLIGSALRLTLDASREGLISYPYVPEFIQDMTWGGSC